MTSIFDEAKAELDKGLEEVEQWIPELKARAAKTAEAAATDLAKYEGNPLVSEITKAIDGGLHIPDSWVGTAVDFLQKFAALAGDTATTGAPAAPAAPAAA